MEDALALVDKILEEHKVIRQRAQNLEQVANDAEAISGLDEAKDAFMPGRFGQAEGLQKLQKLLETIEKGLEGHFNLEETALLEAFERYGNRELTSTLRSILLEHTDLKSRLTHSKKHINELLTGGLSRHVWEATAHDMRAHISHTRKLLEAHAEIEQELFHELRQRLMEGK